MVAERARLPDGVDVDAVTWDPLNAHTPFAALASRVTPSRRLFTRNNFAIPLISRKEWSLTVRDARAPLRLGFEDILALAPRDVETVFECAGNGRSSFEPAVVGTPWGDRAVGCVSFRGAPLARVLERAGVPAGTVEIVFRGGDGGAFERSLPLGVAMAEDTLLAWEMNGEPLLPLHGAPVRLVVPSWYGVASVKWLVDVRASSVPFRGHFQWERYVYARSENDPDAVPVREKRVNSLIVHPALDATVRAGHAIDVRGWAWSGAGRIARVEVSADGGATWRDADLDEQPDARAWRGFRCEVRAVGSEAELLSRATDERGNAQPDAIAWNHFGYGHNAPKPRRVRVVAE